MALILLINYYLCKMAVAEFDKHGGLAEKMFFTF